MTRLLGLICMLFVFVPAILAQETHGIDADWLPAVQASNTLGEASGVVGRNLAVDSQGKLHLVWTEQNQNSLDVYYARSADGGITWSASQDIVPEAQLPVFSPNIVVGSDDTLHLVWNARAPQAVQLHYRQSRDGGNTWSAPIVISGDIPRNAAGHSISVDLRHRVHVAWHVGNPDTDAEATQIYYTRSVDNGSTFAVPRRLNMGSGHAAFPRFTVEGTSGDVLAVAWRDNRNQPDWDVYLAVSTDGGATFTERVGHAARRNREWDPEVLVDAAGILHLAYMDLGQPPNSYIVYLQSADAGQTWTTARTVSKANGRFPFWAADFANDGFWLFWKDEQDFLTPACPQPSRCADIIGMYSNDGGQTWSDTEFVTDYGAEELKFPAFAVSRTGIVYATWSIRNATTNRETVYVTHRTSAP